MPMERKRSEGAALAEIQTVWGLLLHGPAIELEHLGELAHLPVAAKGLTERWGGLPGS